MKTNNLLASVLVLCSLTSITGHAEYPVNAQYPKTENPVYAETRLGLEEILNGGKTPAEEISQIKPFVSDELNKHPESYKMVASSAVGTLANFAEKHPNEWSNAAFFSAATSIGQAIRGFAEKENISKREINSLLNRLAEGAKAICKNVFGESIFAGLYSTIYTNTNTSLSPINSSLPPNYFNNNARPFPTPSPASPGGIK
jgi:hypothetical protein